MKRILFLSVILAYLPAVAVDLECDDLTAEQKKDQVACIEWGEWRPLTTTLEGKCFEGMGAGLDNQLCRVTVLASFGKIENRFNNDETPLAQKTAVQFGYNVQLINPTTKEPIKNGEDENLIQMKTNKKETKTFYSLQAEIDSLHICEYGLPVAIGAVTIFSGGVLDLPTLVVTGGRFAMGRFVAGGVAGAVGNGLVAAGSTYGLTAATNISLDKAFETFFKEEGPNDTGLVRKLYTQLTNSSNIENTIDGDHLLKAESLFDEHSRRHGLLYAIKMVFPSQLDKMNSCNHTLGDSSPVDKSTLDLMEKFGR